LVFVYLFSIAARAGRGVAGGFSGNLIIFNMLLPCKAFGCAGCFCGARAGRHRRCVWVVSANVKVFQCTNQFPGPIRPFGATFFPPLRLRAATWQKCLKNTQNAQMLLRSQTDASASADTKSKIDLYFRSRHSSLPAARLSVAVGRMIFADPLGRRGATGGKWIIDFI